MGRPGKQIPPISDADFWRCVNKTRTCWLYTGKKDSHGYGIVIRKRKTVSGRYLTRYFVAHRVAFGIGKIASGLLEVMHECDNPPCIRPSHLKLGTHRENILDAVKRRRGVGAPFGNKNRLGKKKRR